MEVSGLIKTISQALPLGLESAQLYINLHKNFQTYQFKDSPAKKSQIQTIKSDYFLLLCTDYVKNVSFVQRKFVYEE